LVPQGLRLVPRTARTAKNSFHRFAGSVAVFSVVFVRSVIPDRLGVVAL
jgi:hypothetical protein